MPQAADRSRFRLALPFDKVREVSVKMIGLGNIGSHTAVTLAQLGIPQWTLIDPDEVADENIMTQAFDNTHLGWHKVLAVKGLIERINPANESDPSLHRVMKIDASRIEVSGLASGWSHVTVLGTDNIESREYVYNLMLENARSSSRALLVDARMTFDFLEVFFIHVGRDGDKEASYRAGLKERDYVKAGCGASSASYTGKAAAGVIASGVRQYLVGRMIPFHVSLDLANFEMHQEWRDGEKYVEEKFAGSSVA